MSDVGLYAALEAEIIEALTDTPIDGVKKVLRTAGVEDLVFQDTALRPVIGVIDAGAKELDRPAVSSRLVGALSEWQIAVVVTSKRGLPDARTTVRTLLETVRDRVHNVQTATSSRGKYRWISDQYVNVVGGDGSVAAAIATFVIPINFGV